MGKWWSLLFGVVMLGCLGLFIAAPFVDGWWLPPGRSTHADHVDHLFYIILYITGFFFILTEALLVIFMFKYAGKPVPVEAPAAAAAPATEAPNIFQKLFPFINSQHRLELTWTAVPALILLYIAFAQVGTWLEIKDRSRQPAMGKNDSLKKKTTPIPVEVSARQFEWRIRYPSSSRLKSWLEGKNEGDFKDFGNFRHTRPRSPQLDDVRVVNELHLWKDQTILVYLNTLDVIHSFNIPYMRVKQDALPGKTIPVWFTPIMANTRYNEERQRWEEGIDPKTGKSDHRNFRWEIACAELCGWGHHRMIGRVYVHETKEDFFRWLTHVEKEQVPPTKEEMVAGR